MTKMVISGFRRQVITGTIVIRQLDIERTFRCTPKRTSVESECNNFHCRNVVVNMVCKIPSILLLVNFIDDFPS